MRFILLFVSFLLFSIVNVHAQECENIRAEYDNVKVYIYFDLTGGENENYFVTAHCSKDAFKTPLKYVSGAAGRNIKQGKNLKIIWDCKKEYNEVNLTEIDFKVAAAKVAPANYYTVNVSGKLKRGNKISLSWCSGSSNEDIIIDLYKKDHYYKRIVSTLDLGTFEWTIADNIEKGSDYQIRISNPEKNEFFSDRFEIK